MSWEQDQARAEQLAELWYTTYERRKVEATLGYEPPEAAITPWTEVSEETRKLITDTCWFLLRETIEFTEDLTKKITIKQARAVMRRAMQHNEGFRMGYVANVAGTIHEYDPEKYPIEECNEIGIKVINWLFFLKA